MEAFARIFGITFVAHRINHPDRKARIERTFFGSSGICVRGLEKERRTCLVLLGFEKC